MILILLWPILVAAVALLGFSAINRGDRQPRQSWASDTSAPRGVVEALWAYEDRVGESIGDLMLVGTLDALLSKAAATELQQAAKPYSERQIDSENKIDPDRFIVKATLTVSPLLRREEGPSTVWRRYLVVKDAGHWRIEEVRAECMVCLGKGWEKCYACSGTGVREYLGGKCSECSGTGRKQCDPCSGVGWTNLLKTSSGLGSVMDY